VREQGEGVVISEKETGERHEVSQRARDSYVVSTNVGESKIISEHIADTRIINTEHHNLEEIRSQGNITHSQVE